MKSFIFSTVVAGLLIHASVAPAATITNFFTKFEPGEGYSTELDLVGQKGWLGDGTGGNGIVSNFITNEGQQAYIGYAAPAPTNDNLVIWQPINFDPIAAGYPIVKFSVLMNIVNSEDGPWDIFRWSVYNSQVDRLFSIDFDNDFQDISYLLDGTNEVFFTYLPFFNDTSYNLTVTMNFASNHWSATVNDTLIASNQPITTTDAPLNLGDVDAVWLIHQSNGTNTPGENYMLFDNYHITAETLPVAPPVTPAQVQFFGRTTEGWPVLRVYGDNGSRWALEATSNFVNWTGVKTNVISGSYYTEVDTNTAGPSHRFYRARFVP